MGISNDTAGATRERDWAWIYVVHRGTPSDGLMIDTSCTADQMSYRLICQVLRGVLRDYAELGEVDSQECRAVAALYTLLLEHPIDRRGRCLSCGRARMVFGCRRQCRIYRVTHYWLHRSTALLVSSLTRELGLTVPPLPITKPEPDQTGPTITGRSEQDDTDESPTIEATQTDPHAPDHQAPVLPSPLSAPGSDVPGTGWPDPDHGGAGDDPDGLWSRRGPSDNPGPGAGPVVLATGGLTWSA
jgi:hypothetical protein